MAPTPTAASVLALACVLAIFSGCLPRDAGPGGSTGSGGASSAGGSGGATTGSGGIAGTGGDGGSAGADGSGGDVGTGGGGGSPATGGATGSGGAGGAGGSAVMAPSCAPGGPGMTDCGSAPESCCTSLDVAGGTYNRT